MYDTLCNNEPVVIIDPRTALQLIQKQCGNDGHSATSTWNAVWDADQCFVGSWSRHKRSPTTYDYQVRANRDGITNTGVPFQLSTLTGVSQDVVNALCVRTAPAVADPT